MGKYYKAGVGFVDPDWKQIEDLRKMLKEVVFQFEGLVRFVAEDEYMDDELEALFVALLSDARKVLDGKAVKPKIGGTVITKLWKEDVEAYRRILLLHGDHKNECVTNPLRPVWHPEEDCDCGWREIYTEIGLYEVVK